MKVVKEIKSKKNPFLTPENLKVCAYVRVSTKNPGQLNSFQYQKEYYERIIRRNPSYEYCGIFSDEGI